LTEKNILILNTTLFYFRQIVYSQEEKLFPSNIELLQYV
jgi:hypothetical protein